MAFKLFPCTNKIDFLSTPEEQQIQCGSARRDDIHTSQQSSHEDKLTVS
jgi:hypothetical protein